MGLPIISEALLVERFTVQQFFIDTANHWSKKIVATAYAEVIAQGYSEILFGPDDLSTREQMAVIIVRAFGLAQQSSTQTYADQAHISAWASDDIKTAAAYGLFTGYHDGTLNTQSK